MSAIIDSSYGCQVQLLAQLKEMLKPEAPVQTRYDIFSRLDPNVQFRGYQLLCPEAQDKREIAQKGIDQFLKNPAALAGNIEELFLYVKSRVPSPEERTEAVAACLLMPRGIAVLIAKYAMERFDDEFFGAQHWKTYWGATPVILPSTEKLQGRVNQVVTSTGRRPDKDIEEMSAEECANFLGMLGQEEHPEAPEEMYECLNRRVRPDDKLVAGFTCTVTYVPQFVRKNGRILAVTARTLALDLGPNPLQGETAILHGPDHIFNPLLAREEANTTRPSHYFVMERDIVPNTKGKEISVLIGEITRQGDKSWRLPEPRNFFAAVFSRRVWKGECLYGRDPYNYACGPRQDADGSIWSFGGFGADGLFVYLINKNGAALVGACGSRKFPSLIRGS